jgi:hypothetical protein
MMMTLRNPKVVLTIALVLVGLVAVGVESAEAIQSMRLLDIVRFNGDGTLTCAKWCDMFGPCC